jgi:hypothetical protein
LVLAISEERYQQIRDGVQRRRHVKVVAEVKAIDWKTSRDLRMWMLSWHTSTSAQTCTRRPLPSGQRGRHLPLPVRSDKCGVDGVTIVLALQLAEFVALVGELPHHAEEEMTIALRIDDDRTVFVEWKSGALAINARLKEAEIFDLDAFNARSRIGDPDS